MNAQPWLEHKEGGSRFAIRTIIWITRALGHHAGYALLYPICLYFILFRRSSARASRQFLQRALGRRARFRDVFRHHLTFATCLLDRIHLAGRGDGIAMQLHGLDAIEPYLAARRGCLLLGAHLGSFEVARALAARYDVDIKALMYRRNAQAFREVTRRLDPDAERMLIEIGRPDTLLRVSEALDAGSLVGILGDRTIDAARTVEVSFMGMPARLPTGPFLLAAMLNAPLVLFFGLCRGPGVYDVYFETLAGTLALSGERDPQLAEIAQRYADRIEYHARRMPYNWFNFYDYWQTP